MIIATLKNGSYKYCRGSPNPVEMPESAPNATTVKVATVVLLILSMVGNFKFLLNGPDHHGKDPLYVKENPFTALVFLMFWYWAFLYAMQILFVVQMFLPMMLGYVLRLQITNLIGHHFAIFNVLHFVWTWLFANRHYFWAEVVLLANMLNIILLYVSHKTYKIRPLSSWLLLHVPVVSAPLSWLLYAVFWNGAILFHVHKFVGRVVSNVLIWDFLIVPAFYLVLYNDWSVSLTTLYIMFALGWRQMFTKLFALQWIFSFVISGLLFVWLAFAAFTGYSVYDEVTLEEAAPLLSA